jgi:hypothetical protein
VRQLETDELPLTVRKVDNPLQRSDLRILPEAAVFGCDPPFGHYGCGLNEREAGPTRDNAAEVGKMPVCMVTIFGGVLAQWR